MLMLVQGHHQWQTVENAMGKRPLTFSTLENYFVFTVFHLV